MNAYVRFNYIQNVGYFLNVFSISDVKFANLVPHWRHLYGQMTGDPNLIFLDF